VIWLESIEATNRITGERKTVARYDGETKVCHVRFNFHESRMRLNDTYNIQDDVMELLALRGCQIIQILEVERPGIPDTEYVVPFADWYNSGTIDYGFGCAQQYAMASETVRKTKAA